MSASTQILTDAIQARDDGPDANSLAAAIAADGPIQDIRGGLGLLVLKVQELKIHCENLAASMDASDPSEDIIQNILLTLV